MRKEIGPIAKPDIIQWAPGLPKTRSGKIMRRILRKIAADELDNLGDTTTLADPSVVDDLIKNRPERINRGRKKSAGPSGSADRFLGRFEPGRYPDQPAAPACFGTSFMLSLTRPRWSTSSTTTSTSCPSFR